MSDCRLTAGSLLTGSQKAGPKAGLSVTAMPSHAVSAKSQTLENKAYHVMSYHDMPAIGGHVGDEGLERWCSTALIYRSSVRAGRFAGDAGGGAHAT